MDRRKISKSDSNRSADGKKIASDESRRSFIGKTIYTVPKLIFLGSFLSRPVKVKADHSGGPPPPPGDW